MAQFFSEGMPGFDVVHVHAVFLWPTWAAARRARLHSVPHIIAPRGMLVGDLIRARGQLKKSISIALFDKRALQSADAVHFTTKREKSDCEALGIRPRHSITIPNGIDLDSVPVRYRHSNPPEIGRSYVLYLGRISWKKGIDRLVRAMADLPNSHLVIAGNDDENYTEHLRSVARDCNVSDRIEFRGHVGGEQKWELLAMASVLALPSISENFGNVIIEALSVGTPVVTTEGVGLAETVRESGTGIVSGPEPANIARSIQEILSNTNAGRLMGDAGRKLVASRFTWSVVAARMETAYLDLVDSNSAAVSREVAGTVSR
jgi:glycosyltransferase involved in cell wall biosynthesis